MNIICPDSYLYDDRGQYVFTKPRSKEAWVKAIQELEALLADPRVEKVILLVGIPGVGKSTWVSQQPDDPSVIYFDATFIKPEWRAPIIKVCQDWGIGVEAVWIKAPPSICRERNQSRPPDRKIPDPILTSMYEQVHKTPPQESEGFDKVTIIRNYPPPRRPPRSG